MCVREPLCRYSLSPEPGMAAEGNHPKPKAEASALPPNRASAKTPSPHSQSWTIPGSSPGGLGPGPGPETGLPRGCRAGHSRPRVSLAKDTLEMMFGGTLRMEVMCSGRLTLYGSEMWTPAQRSARLPPPARAAGRPARGVPGSEFVLPRASASGSTSPSAPSAESFSNLSGISGLGWGLLGANNPSGSVEERSRRWPPL